ncbi:MAG: hypothetical protein MJA29_00535, partial [Candidatus Omnitrophica bacterium]|nr:hypothetical protein [Candidatus Omnitrophota bacterium]
MATNRLPISEYIAATKQICDVLGENSQKVDCSDYYHKVKDLLTSHQGKRVRHNITREEKEALKTLRDDKDRMVLTADKGVAMVVMDKSQYIEKCLALLNDPKVYAESRDLTRTIHNKVIATLRLINRKDEDRLYEWKKDWYHRLLPSGSTSPPARFYGLPKIHKANCPMRPIVSACGTSTYNLAKFLTQILQTYVGKTQSFVKDSHDLVRKLSYWEIADDEELVSFDVSALFTSIPVSSALQVINELFIDHMDNPEAKYLYGKSFESNCSGLNKDEVMSLLDLVLNNCVFTFQNKFYKQLHGAAMGSPCSPVVANIYMEFFENKALSIPNAPINTDWWYRYVDDCLTKIKKGNQRVALDFLNSIDEHIKFTIEEPNGEGAIPFLDTHPRPVKGKVECKVYRKPTHTDKYLDWNSNHPLSAKRAVVRALTDRAFKVCSTPEALNNEIEHLHTVLKYNNYPKWMLEKKGRLENPPPPLINPETGNEITKCKYVSVPYFPGVSEKFKSIFKYTPIQVCFKGNNTLKSLLMHPKDPVEKQVNKDVVYKWNCKDCDMSYIGETCRPLVDRVKEHSKSGTSSIYAHHVKSGHQLPTVEDFSIIDRESNQVRREAKEAIHIKRLDPQLNRNIGRMNIPSTFNVLLGVKPKHN